MFISIFSFFLIIILIFIIAADENSINTNESPCNSLTGSFISDTLTLNGGNSNDIVKFKLNTKSKNDNFNDIRNDLVIVGKALGKNVNNELYEDEKVNINFN